MFNSREQSLLAALKIARRYMPEVAPLNPDLAPVEAAIVDAESAAVAPEPKPGDPIKVWALTIVHRHGDDTSLFSSHAEAHAALAAFVNEWWPRELADRAKPDDPQEAVDAYFELVGENYSLTESGITLPVPAAPASPALMTIVQEATEAFEEGFDESMKGPDTVNAHDLADWFAEWRLRAKDALTNAAMDAAEAMKRALAEADRLAAEKAPDKLPSLAVIMEGGLVQDIVSDMPEAVKVEAIYVIDYDTEGSDRTDMSFVRQSDGQYAIAFVHDEGIGKAKIDLAQVDMDDRARDSAVEEGWRRATVLEENQGFDRFQHDDKGEQSDAATWTDLCKEQEIEIE